MATSDLEYKCEVEQKVIDQIMECVAKNIPAFTTRPCRDFRIKVRVQCNQVYLDLRYLDTLTTDKLQTARQSLVTQLISSVQILPEGMPAGSPKLRNIKMDQLSALILRCIAELGRLDLDLVDTFAKRTRKTFPTLSTYLTNKVVAEEIIKDTGTVWEFFT